MKKDDSRVLARTRARKLTDEETAKAMGGFGTLTLCSIGPKGPDGDPHECGW